jgi:hypothetical protein
VSIDGDKIQAESVSVVVSTPADVSGMPKMGSNNVVVRAVVDFHDEANVGYTKLSKFFDLAYMPKQDDIKDIKITFWEGNDQQQSLVAYKFQGWISRYETSHQPFTSDGRVFNHMLVLDLQPKLNQQGAPDLQISNG